MKPHKHAAIIKAWADGLPIEQYNEFSNRWMEVSGWTPDFSEDVQYRLKVGATTIDYRELLKKYMAVVAEVHGHDCLPYCSDRPEFDLSDEEFDELDRLSQEAGTA